MLPCNCDVGMCTHRPNCRQHRAYVTTGELTMADEARTKADRIERLRRRLAKVHSNPMDMVPIIKGILDLLADEL